MPPINSTYGKFSHNLVGLAAFDLVAQRGDQTAASEDLGISRSEPEARKRS